MNQAVKRWVAVKPRPQSVLGVVSTGAVGWARMRLNQAVKRWVAVEPRPQSVLGVVSTGAVGWAWVIPAHLLACARAIVRSVCRGGVVVWLFQGRSPKGNGSFRTRASEASPSQRRCVRVRACVRIA